MNPKEFLRKALSFIKAVSEAMYEVIICHLFLPKDPRKIKLRLKQTRVTDLFGMSSTGVNMYFSIFLSKKELLKYSFWFREEDLFDELSLEVAVIELRRFGEVPDVLCEYLKKNISEIYDMVIHEKIKLML